MTEARDIWESGFDAFRSQAAILAADGDIVAVNRAWEEFGRANGRERPDDGDANYLQVCDGSKTDDGTDVSEGLRGVLAGERETFTHEYPCHGPNERRWFSLRATRYRHEGRPYALVVHFDITDRKLAELAVQEQNERLETVVGVLSHDLRNPLNVAMGRAEMLDDSENADRVVDALERMETMVENALVFARPGSPDDRRAVDLESAVSTAWSHVETRDATLSVDGACTFEADPNLVEHLFENLLSNAVEHGGDRVAVGRLDDGFYVEDDGPGVPPDAREAVFETGYTSDGDGTGFGLAIVDRVAAVHDWDLRLSSGSEGGARFEFSL